MRDSNIGTHQSHCCMKHGCKYDCEDCPIVLKQVKQDYPCYRCSFLDDMGYINPPQQWKLPDEWDLMPNNSKYFFWSFGHSYWGKELIDKSEIKCDPDCFWSAYGPIDLPRTSDPKDIEIDDSDYPF